MRHSGHYSTEEIITALYGAALGRAPDPGGLQHYTDALNNGQMNLSDIADILHYCDERADAISNSVAVWDHSQFGELMMVLKLLLNPKGDSVVVDVGARGRERSNSYDIAKHFGWRLLLVEANPALYPAIRREFAGTDFVLAECAVGPKEGVMPLYIGVNDDVSSLVAENAQGWGPIKGQVNVPVRRLPALLSEHRVPTSFDLLSVDIEGVDVVVLNDLIDNSPYRPKIVIIEASFDFRTKSLADVNASSLVQSQYEIAGQTAANLILRRRV